jgi:hypothetical protein
MSFTIQAKWHIKFKMGGQKSKVIISLVPSQTLNLMEENPFQLRFTKTSCMSGIMELEYFTFSLGGWFLRCTHQLGLDQEASLLKLCLAFTWRHPFLALIMNEVSFYVYYSIIVYYPMFYGIKLVMELEWFSLLTEDF